MFDTTVEHEHREHFTYGVYPLCPVMGECEAQYDSGCTGEGQCQVDPFDIEVHEEINYRILCDHCAGRIADDV